MTYVEPRKKRRWLAPVIILGVLIGLVVAAFFVAESLARDYAADLVSRPIKQALALPPGTDVTVDFGGGSLLLQAASGSLDEVTISVDAAAIGPTTGSATLVANQVPLSTDGTIGSLAATLSVDAAALLALAPQLGAVAFADGTVVATTTVDVLGQPVPAIVSLAPAAAEGQLTLAVTALTLNGEAMDVAAVQAGSFGPAAAALVAPQSVCVAQLLPASLRLTDASIAADALVLRFTGSDVPLSGEALATKGSCA